jgi:hypothetical protein
MKKMEEYWQGDNIDDRMLILQPNRFQCDGEWISSGLPFT